LKSCYVLQDHYDDERDKTVFHNTTPDLQDQDQEHSVQDHGRFFWVSDRSCPKTDGLRPHHWSRVTVLAICDNNIMSLATIGG